MSHSPKVQQIAQQILDAFEAGTVPAALAQVFIRHKKHSDYPAARWSWGNQLTAALSGHYDARGFRQWQQVGRNVRKGERAFYILGPCMVKDKEAEPSEEPTFRLVGFTAIPVFGYQQTEGDPLPGHEEEEDLNRLASAGRGSPLLGPFCGNLRRPSRGRAGLVPPWRLYRPGS